MTDFETILRDAIKQDVSIEDVMKDITAAANTIEKEIAAATKYDGYNKTVAEHFPDLTSESAAEAIIYAKKISIHDMAVVMTHFICQHVPGFTSAMVKCDSDPLETYTNLMESQIAAAKVIADTQDKTEEEKGAAMFTHLLDEIIGSLAGGTKSPMDIPWPAGRVAAPVTTAAKSDEQKMADFFRRAGL